MTSYSQDTEAQPQRITSHWIDPQSLIGDDPAVVSSIRDSSLIVAPLTAPPLSHTYVHTNLRILGATQRPQNAYTQLNTNRHLPKKWTQNPPIKEDRNHQAQETPHTSLA